MNNISFPNVFSTINLSEETKSHKKISFFKNLEYDRISFPELSNESESIFDFRNLPQFDSINRAIGTITAKAEGTSKPFLLVAGDLSGIQDTVFNISSKGALKSLRARSFMLELLCEHICYEIIHNCLGDYLGFLNHKVFSGGGGFCLLLPATDENIAKVEIIGNNINDWAFEEFSGKLFVSIAHISLSEEELEMDDIKTKGVFKENWNKLANLLDIKKRKKFLHKIDAIFNSENLIEPTLKTNSQSCQICQRDDINLTKSSMYEIPSGKKLTTNEIFNERFSDNNIPVHELCFQLFRLGERLPGITNFYRTKNKPNQPGYITFPDINNAIVYYTLDKTKEIESTWTINSIQPDTTPFFYANYVRLVSELNQSGREAEISDDSQIKSNDTATFTGLAYSSCGAPFLGCLRMDVDNMGKVFQEGLPIFNLVIISNLSFMLNLFFKSYLKKICYSDFGNLELSAINLTRKEYQNKGRNVSVVYSGGDDLFIMGAWDEISELAFDIQKAFYNFSGLGISASVTVHKHDFPLYQIAKICGEGLDAAKSFIEIPGTKPRKNKISLFFNQSYIEKKKNSHFNYALSWENRELFSLLKNLLLFTVNKENRLELNSISHNLIRKLFDLSQMWRLSKIMYLPQIYYVLKRARKNIKEQELINAFSEIENTLIKIPISNTNTEIINSLRFPLTWFELLLRNKGELS